MNWKQKQQDVRLITQKLSTIYDKIDPSKVLDLNLTASFKEIKETYFNNLNVSFSIRIDKFKKIKMSFGFNELCKFIKHYRTEHHKSTFSFVISREYGKYNVTSSFLKASDNIQLTIKNSSGGNGITSGVVFIDIDDFEQIYEVIEHVKNNYVLITSNFINTLTFETIVQKMGIAFSKGLIINEDENEDISIIDPFHDHEEKMKENGNDTENDECVNVGVELVKNDDNSSSDDNVEITPVEFDVKTKQSDKILSSFDIQSDFLSSVIENQEFKNIDVYEGTIDGEQMIESDTSSFKYDNSSFIKTRKVYDKLSDNMYVMYDGSIVPFYKWISSIVTIGESTKAISFSPIYSMLDASGNLEDFASDLVCNVDCYNIMKIKNDLKQYLNDTKRSGIDFFKFGNLIEPDTSLWNFVSSLAAVLVTSGTFCYKLSNTKVPKKERYRIESHERNIRMMKILYLPLIASVSEKNLAEYKEKIINTILEFDKSDFFGFYKYEFRSITNNEFELTYNLVKRMVDDGIDRICKSRIIQTVYDMKDICEKNNINFRYIENCKSPTDVKNSIVSIFKLNNQSKDTKLMKVFTTFAKEYIDDYLYSTLVTKYDSYRNISDFFREYDCPKELVFAKRIIDMSDGIITLDELRKKVNNPDGIMEDESVARSRVSTDFIDVDDNIEGVKEALDALLGDL